MFTGIIEEIGNLAAVRRKGQTLELLINAKIILSDIKLGDSIAVNGVCLTVVRFSAQQFAVDVMPVTFQATNLHQLSVGDQLNLERAMAANGRFGGHFVSGHIDGVAMVSNIEQAENALVYTLKLPQALLSSCITKGSIALDGTSLTLFRVNEESVSVSLIPHTRKSSILGMKSVGATVNVECDVLLKQLTRNLEPVNGSSSRISVEFLAEHGYI